MTKVLGIDFGTKRIGLALSFASLAEPLTIVENDATVFANIQQIITKEKVGQLVCGISEGEMAVKTKQFATELALFTKLPIEYVDETLSSQVVRAKTQTKRSSNSHKPVDHFAAAEILQEWLDMQPAKVYA
ncbi:MAG: Holliday junction resolvase RuvX [Candidatus Pacebacteria bacterium]|nr:Holliday junction resolvase RuvX [Candidatus Paceibacterota bacterium]PIR59797.1 MAG: Holliday junction resolvase RuvX [Candidatus Pacebacteria bacterium CG10_big_fil_rev_8_21_14_0_10_45_6]